MVFRRQKRNADANVQRCSVLPEEKGAREMMQNLPGFSTELGELLPGGVSGIGQVAGIFRCEAADMLQHFRRLEGCM